MRIKINRFLAGGFCCFALFWATALRAESLEEMTALAKKYDARYLAAHAEYEAAVFRADQALSKLLPALSANGNLARNNAKVTYDDSKIANFDREYTTNDWSAQIAQPLFHVEDWAGTIKARRAKEQSRCNLQQAEAELSLRLAQAYYDFLFAKENENLLEAEKRTLTEKWLSAKGLHQAGAVAAAEPLQVQARLALIVANILEAKWEVANKQRLLETMVGINITEPEPVKENMTEITWGTLDDWLQRVSENPQVRAADFSLKMAKQDEWRASSGFWPGIDAVGMYQEALAGPSAALPIETKSKTSSVGVRCTWALFSGGGTLAEYGESKKNQEKAEAERLFQ